VKWEAAAQLFRGHGEDNAATEFERLAPNMRNPDMVLAVENQWLAEMTGGPDKTKVLSQALEIEEKARSAATP
jgi:hypothetical protein